MGERIKNFTELALLTACRGRFQVGVGEKIGHLQVQESHWVLTPHQQYWQLEGNGAVPSIV